MVAFANAAVFTVDLLFGNRKHLRFLAKFLKMEFYIIKKKRLCFYSLSYIFFKDKFLLHFSMFFLVSFTSIEAYSFLLFIFKYVFIDQMKQLVPAFFSSHIIRLVFTEEFLVDFRTWSEKGSYASLNRNNWISYTYTLHRSRNFFRIFLKMPLLVGFCCNISS